MHAVKLDGPVGTLWTAIVYDGNGNSAHRLRVRECRDRHNVTNHGRKDTDKLRRLFKEHIALCYLIQMPQIMVRNGWVRHFDPLSFGIQ